MGAVIAVVVVLALVGGGIGIVFAVRRHQYVQSLRDRGWVFVNSPDVAVAYGLNNPPFGVGLDRAVDDLVLGTTSSGIQFRAFEYSASGGSCPGYVVTMPLPRSMPEFYAMPPVRPRPLIRALQIESAPLVVVADDPDYAHAVMAVVRPHLAALGAAAVPDLSIDHASLVALGAPKEAPLLAAFTEALAPIVHALADPTFDRWASQPPPRELGVYDHPGWVYRPRDDSVLGLVRHHSGGQNHRATNVFFGNEAPLPFIACTHLWETTRTETSTDSEGRTTTRTVTDHHSENLLEFQPSFPFREFRVNAGLVGDKVTFESSDFNDRFTVRCPDARFASDVFHPRQMEYLMRSNPPPFWWDEDGRLGMRVAHDPAEIAEADAFLRGFFARVPNFVWENLGLAEPPLRV